LPARKADPGKSELGNARPSYASEGDQGRRPNQKGSDPKCLLRSHGQIETQTGLTSFSVPMTGNMKFENLLACPRQALGKN
jgi:hypothetical protein